MLLNNNKNKVIENQRILLIKSPIYIYIVFIITKTI